MPTDTNNFLSNINATVFVAFASFGVDGEERCRIFRGNPMYMVYWSESSGTAKTPHSQEFPSDDLVSAMRLMEQLRTRQRAGELVSMIAMASEHPDAIGPTGVADARADYAWKKRRR